MGIVFWIIAACFFAGVEILIPALVTIWFALAAFLLTGMVFFFPMFLWNPFLEWKVFIVLSIILLLITRPFSKKYLEKRKERFHPNFVGKEIEVVKVIKEGYYEGRFKGIIWTLLSEDYSIQVGDKVQIVSYEGNQIIVKKKED